MPIYTKRTNIKKYSKKKIVGICLAVIFSLLLINLMFGIVKPINQFFLGSMGILYAVTCITMIALSIFLIIDRDINVDYRCEVVLIAIITLLFLLLLQLATVSNIPFNGFVQSMKQIYARQYTMGGVLLGAILYPLVAFTHKIATVVVLLIPLIILAALLVFRIYQRVTNQLVKKPVVQKPEPQQMVAQELREFEHQEEEKVVVDDDIFIADTVLEEKQKEKSEKMLAKELLGLAPRSAETVVDKVVETKEPIEEDTSEGRRPKKIIHRGDMWNEEEKQVVGTQGRILSETDRKNLAFLRATQGKSTKDLKTPNKDLYDVGLNSSNYKQFVKPKFENPEVKYNQYHSNEWKQKEDEWQPKQNAWQPKQKPSFFTPEDTEEEVPYKSNNKPDWEVETKEVDTVKEKPAYRVSNVLGNFTQSFYEKEKTDTKPAQTQEHEIVQEKVVEKPKPKKPYRYTPPPIDLLNKVESSEATISEDYEEKAYVLEQTLANFNIKAKVVSIVHGPTFSRFELQMPQGIPVKRVSGYVDDIAMALESHGNIRMEIPIKGKSAFGVEVPNRKTEKVPLRDIIDSDQFRAIKNPTAFALGKDITGEPQLTRIDKMKHVLIAGSTGSGKSVCMNALLLSLLYKASPEDVRLIIIDPKRVEFTPYNGIPHLLIPNVICDVDKAVMALKWTIDEMERRFALFSREFVRDLGEYNQTEGVRSGVNPKLPYLLVIVDELADLMLQNKKEIEESLNRLLAKSRAAGIHLILATQRPSVDVITGTLKNNLPAKIAFKVSSAADSKTIIGTGGAEKLLGRGDMLFVPEDDPDGHRIQGALVENSEIAAVVNFVKENNECDFDETIEEAMFNKSGGTGGTGGKDIEYDPLLKEACRNVIVTNSVSISKIQRLLGVGYPRAGKIVDQMIAAGFISDRDSNNKYTIFITQQEFEEKFGEDL